MNSDRLMHLLKKAVEHIEAFEDRESEIVLKSLGFTDEELAAIRFEPKWDEKDKENIHMVEGKVFHHGEVIWQLSSAGMDYIFSDFRENPDVPDEYITENIPFKNYSHYFYYDEDRDIYCGCAYYAPTESYAQDFDTLDECLEWLVPDPELELVERKLIETKGDLGLWEVTNGKETVYRITDDGHGYCNSIEELATYYKGDEVGLVKQIINKGNPVFFEDSCTGEKKSFDEYQEQFAREDEYPIFPYVNFESLSSAKEVLGLLEELEIQKPHSLEKQEKSSLSEKIEEAKAQQKEGEISFAARETEKSL